MRRKRAAEIMSRRKASREGEDSGGRVVGDGEAGEGGGGGGGRRKERNYHLRIVSLWGEQERIKVGGNEGGNGG